VGTARNPIGVPTMLTQEGKLLLERRAQRLRDEVLPAIASRLAEPDRDAQVEAEHRRATDELADIEYLIRHAPVAEEIPGDPQIIEVGDEVTVGFEDGSTERYLIVHPLEATLDDLRISAESPLARALLGSRIGEVVEVAAPAGSYHCTIVAAKVRNQQGTRVPQESRPAWPVADGRHRVVGVAAPSYEPDERSAFGRTSTSSAAETRRRCQNPRIVRMAITPASTNATMPANSAI